MMQMRKQLSRAGVGAAHWRSSLRRYAFALVVVVLFTAVGFSTHGFLSYRDKGMVLLLGVVLVAYREERGPVLFAVVCGVAAFDFFFVPPYYTLAVSNPEFLISFAAFAVVGVTISSLRSRVREQECAANEAKLIAEAEKTRNALLSSVSHNLRTPLGSIIGSVSTLRDVKLDDAARAEMVETIREEAEYLQRLLDNLLQMTRLSDGKLIVRNEWQVPEEIVGAALRRLGTAVAHRRIHVEIDPAIGLARFDGLLVELALVNVLDNAIKYSGEGSDINISVSREDGEVIWQVRDEGPGVPSEEQQRVFDKFYRVPGRHERGSGLGLAIVRAIADVHGGRAWVESPTAGPHGALVGFALPAGHDAPSLPVEETHAA